MLGSRWSGWISSLLGIVRRIVHSGVVWLVALIVVNIAYVGWSWLPAGSGPAIASPQLSSIGPSLRLLAENPLQQFKTVSGPQLTLLSESGAKSRPESGPEADLHLVEQQQERGPIQVVCRVWGPFNNRTELEKVEADIAAAGGETRVTESTVPGRSDYLVYIRTPGQAENARRVLEELKSQAIDSALITRGRFNNTLSVGVFSRNDRAQRQMIRVSKLGYDVAIKEIDRSYNVFHLEARVVADFEPAVAPIGPCREIAQAY